MFRISRPSTAILLPNRNNTFLLLEEALHNGLGLGSPAQGCGLSGVHSDYPFIPHTYCIEANLELLLKTETPKVLGFVHSSSHLACKLHEFMSELHFAVQARVHRALQR